MDSVNIEVTRIIKKMDGGFTIARGILISTPYSVGADAKEIIVKGEFETCSPQNTYHCEGHWKDCGENGLQFIGERNTLVLTNSQISIVSYIKEKVKGVSKKLLNTIVKNFGEDTLEIIKNSPERLETIDGMTKKKIELIHQAILKGTWDIDFAPHFTKLGFEADEILEIYNKYGIYSWDKLEENPYLFRGISGIEFKHIDKAAKLLGMTSMDIRRLEAGIFEYLQFELKTNGHLCIKRDELESSIYPFLNSNGIDSMIIPENTNNTYVSNAIETMVKNSKLNEDSGYIYIPYFYMVETGLVENIKKRINSTTYKTSEEITAFLQDSDFGLTTEQIEAVQMVIHSKVSLLTGGPGTGKTRTIKAILATIKKFQPYSTVELAAPTGVAAMMMENLTNCPAKTIHRLIGLSGQAEESTILQRVNSDYLIIDESSMLDASLAFYLFQATSHKTKILLVGDAEQLGCIGAGNIFKDMLKCRKNVYGKHQIEQVTLTQTHRQAAESQIITNANRVKNGESTLSIDKSKSDFHFIKKSKISDIKQYIIASIKRLLDLGLSMDDIQILSPQNKGELGTIQLNKLIQEVFNPYKSEDETLRVGERVFRIGDRVIHTVNNYDLNVFNGEIGKIIAIDGDTAIIKYVGKEIIYTLDNIGELFLAYAITVHKAQGSEFPVVIIPFHPILANMIHRKLIYTAITRASKRVIIIGDEDCLKLGIETVEVSKGNSNIEYRLAGLKKIS